MCFASVATRLTFLYIGICASKKATKHLICWCCRESTLLIMIFRLYKQLQRDKKGLPGLTHSHRKMWEAVIEAACRADDTEWALQVRLLAQSAANWSSTHNCTATCICTCNILEHQRMCSQVAARLIANAVEKLPASSFLQTAAVLECSF